MSDRNASTVSLNMIEILQDIIHKIKINIYYNAIQIQCYIPVRIQSV